MSFLKVIKCLIDSLNYKVIFFCLFGSYLNTFWVINACIYSYFLGHRNLPRIYYITFLQVTKQWNYPRRAKAGSHLCGAVRRVANKSEIRQSMQHGTARRVASKVSCFKMGRVVSLALLCEEAENEEYEVRSKRKRFWAHEINLTRNANGKFSTLFEYLLRD